MRPRTADMIATRVTIGVTTLLAVLCVGCSNHGRRAIQSGERQRPRLSDDRESLAPVDPAPFNKRLIAAKASGESWVVEPIQVALHFVADDWKDPDAWECSQRRILLEPQSPGLSVTVEAAGLHDDSIEGEKTVMLLQRESSEVWVVVSAKKGQRCWQERGTRITRLNLATEHRCR